MPKPSGQQTHTACLYVHYTVTAIVRLPLHVAGDHGVVHTMYNMFTHVFWCGHHARGAVL